jgi:hypothetical protein
MRNALDLYSVSGGGFWRFGPEMSQATSPPLLSAIGTEWHPKGLHRYVVGTPIWVAVEALARHYADVNAFVRARIRTLNDLAVAGFKTC